MGDEIKSKGGVTLQAHLPQPAEIRLLKDGKVIQIWRHSQACAYSVSEPGVYRVEAWRSYLGLKRGWVFSNPIYVFVGWCVDRRGPGPVKVWVGFPLAAVGRTP